MTKAILVIEMPKNCYECKLRKQELFDGYFCGLNEVLGEKNHIDCLVKRLNNCPLKELPQRIYNIENYEGIAIPTQDDYTKGFNDCLEEIERKKINVCK